MSRVIGDHLLCDSHTLVFTHIWGGVTYVVAARVADGVLVNYLQLSGANATTVIMSAINALSAGRTWKEKVTVKGNYTDLGQISAPNWIELEIIGRWTAQAALNVGTGFIVNSDQTNGNTEIEIHGGYVDANRAGQAQNLSVIFFNATAASCTYCWVHHVKATGGNYIDNRGNGIEFRRCTHCYCTNCEAFSCEYDCIAGYYTDYSVWANNIVRETMDPGNGIQVAFGDLNVISHNVIQNSSITGSGGGIRVAHLGAYNNVIEGNTILNQAFGIVLNGVNGNMYSTVVMGNSTYGCNNGIITLGAASNLVYYTLCIGNMFRYITINFSAIRLTYSVQGYFTENYIIDQSGAATAINVEATSSNNRFGPHYIYNITTIVTDNGVGTQWPSFSVPLVWSGTGATVAANGILLDADGEWASTAVQMPWNAHTIVKIQVHGVSVVLEADRMRLELRVNAGADNEAFSQHNETVANMASDTLNFAANDIVTWTRTSAVVTAIKGGDNLHVQVLGEVAGDGDIGTNANLRTVTVFFI